MKKLFIPLIILLVLTLVILFFTKSGMLARIIDKFTESDEPKEITDASEPETFTYRKMSITLPGDFAAQNGNGMITISNESYRIRAVHAAHSSITPNEGEPFPSLLEFWEFMLPTYADPVDEITFKNHDGFVYTDCESERDGISSLNVFGVEKTGDTQCIILLESDDAFWAISFYSATLDYETVKAQAFEWVKTVTFAS